MLHGAGAPVDSDFCVRRQEWMFGHRPDDFATGGHTPLLEQYGNEFIENLDW